MMRTLLLLVVMCGTLTAQDFNAATGPSADAFGTGLNVLGTVEDRDRIVVDTRAVKGELDISQAYHNFSTGDVVNLYITKANEDGNVVGPDTTGQHVAVAPPRLVAPVARAAAPAVQYVKRTTCNGRGACTTVWVPVATVAPAPVQAPMQAPPMKTAQAPQPGMHSHKCMSCGYEFWHFPGGSHTCPSCGQGGNYAKYRTSYSSTTATTVTSSGGSGGGRLRNLLPRNWK